jgi:hypothetical protein
MATLFIFIVPLQLNNFHTTANQLGFSEAQTTSIPQVKHLLDNIRATSQQTKQRQ